MHVILITGVPYMSCKLTANTLSHMPPWKDFQENLRHSINAQRHIIICDEGWISYLQTHEMLSAKNRYIIVTRDTPSKTHKTRLRKEFHTVQLFFGQSIRDAIQLGEYVIDTEWGLHQGETRKQKMVVLVDSPLLDQALPLAHSVSIYSLNRLPQSPPSSATAFPDVFQPHWYSKSTKEEGIDHTHHQFFREYPNEKQYLRLLSKVLRTGEETIGRTETPTISIFMEENMVFDISGLQIPLLTTKKMNFNHIYRELLWFLSGSTQASDLAKLDVPIWNQNGSRENLDRLGFQSREEGDLGPVYGFQWRHFGARYLDCHTDYSGQGIDQIQYIIDTLRSEPHSRRIVLNAWNPLDIPHMVLPPCHMMAQFYCRDGKLSCHLYQRSGDVGLGVPYNIASYALLTHMIAHVAGLEAHKLIHSIGDAHVYKHHIEPLQEQLRRLPFASPTIRFQRDVSSIDDFQTDDITLESYKHHPFLKM